MHKNAGAVLVLILVITVIAAFFVVPLGLGKNVMPWRLGLDLVGGAHLVYEVDMRGVSTGDRESVAAGLRDVIEKRVNLFGVSEPQVFSAKSGQSHRLVVELAGITDVASAI